MTRLAAAAFAVVIFVELAALLVPERRVVLLLSGAAVATALLAARWLLGREAAVSGQSSAAADRSAALQRWLVRTQTLIGWSEASRSDWDRHLRPLLARQFEMATGQRRRKDPNGFRATGRLVLGPELWPWVDPDNVARSAAAQPGPGRDVLHEILQRLEQI
ncbi:hypothetical protein [Mycolicibacterium thermoresistibile]